MFDALSLHTRICCLTYLVLMVAADHSDFVPFLCASVMEGVIHPQQGVYVVFR